MNTVSHRSIDSDALKANLLETAEYVEIRADLMRLLEAVEKYRGIHTRLEGLLYEICHPYRNWNLILPLLRSFVLKNFQHYLKTGSGPEAYTLFSDLFFEAAEGSLKNSTLLAQIFEAHWDWIDKLASMLKPAELKAFEQGINDTFNRFSEIGAEDELVLIHLIHGRQSVKRVTERLSRQIEHHGIDWDFMPAARLLKLVLQINYDYWLQEDDPRGGLAI